MASKSDHFPRWRKPFASQLAKARSRSLAQIEKGEVVEVLMSDGEELTIAPRIVRAFRDLAGWSRARLARECASVQAAYYGRGPGVSRSAIAAYERSEGDLSDHERTVLMVTLGQYCWVAVGRGRVGLCLKVAVHDE